MQTTPLNPLKHRSNPRRGASPRVGRAAVETLEARRLLSGGPETFSNQPADALPARQMENLDRGVVAVRSTSTQAFVSWRLLGLDPAGVGFNVYRSANGAPPVKLNPSVLTGGTNFVDTSANFTLVNAYTVRPVVNNVEQPPGEAFTLPASAAVQLYQSVALQIPPGGTTPDNVPYTYNANDASVADLDGDGEYEIILKWDPSNSKDNSQSGYTGNVYLDAYKMNGTRLWRIDLGINIRAGAHYTQFIAYDLDGDGKAEVACKTAPGTKDGLGNNVIRAGDNPSADYRDHDGADGRIGYVLNGPEYLTVFNGQTGAAMATSNFLVARGSVSNWGDSYGNRVDRFLAGVAYLDGVRPSLVMGRGYYERTTISAWNWRNGQLTQAWAQPFDSEDAMPDPTYEGQGTHSLSIIDADGDGRDEIIYGAVTIDDNGQPLATSGLGHGDALHVSDMDPSRPGLEVFQVHEGTGSNGHVGGSLRDAATGQVLVSLPVTQNTDGSWPDVGRGVAADIDPTPGYEFWTSSHGSIYNVNGSVVAARPSNMHQNFLAWWDSDLFRETLDGTTIGDWNYTTDGRQNFDLDPATSGSQSAPGVSSNNGTKSTPALSADLFGDWREEVIWRTSDNTALRIFTTAIATSTRLYTLMHDPTYRLAIAWQNGAYNQPPHPGFFLGDGMAPPPTPNIYFAAAPTSGSVSGQVFHDLDANGIFTLGEPALVGVTVYLDADGDGALGAGEQSATSTAGGSYAFAAVAPGGYTVRTIAPSEFVSAGDPAVVVAGGSSVAAANVPHARIVYNGTANSDNYLLRKNAAGKFELVIGGSLTYTVFAGAPSLAFNLGGGDDTLTLDLAQGVPLPSGGVNFDAGSGANDRIGVVGSAAGEGVSFDSGVIAFGLGGGVTVTHSSAELATFHGNNGWDTLAVGGTSSLEIGGSQQLSSLALTGSARVTMSVGGIATVVTRQLAVGPAARLDLADNDLILDYDTQEQQAFQTADAAVFAGINGGTWDGVGGLTTSMPDAVAGLTTLGLAEASAVFGLEGAATREWSGQTIDATSVLVKYTYAGDANLDGMITGDDYSAVDFHVAQAGASGYFNGDFNHDGIISGDDYSIIDFNIVAQGAPL